MSEGINCWRADWSSIREFPECCEALTVLGCALRMLPLIQLLVQQPADLSHQGHQALGIRFRGRLFAKRLPRLFGLTFHFPSGLLAF